MKRKEDENIKRVLGTMEQRVSETYEKSKWDKFCDAVGATLIVIFGLILIIVIVVLGIYLIENPTSLAIICGTILLIFMWGSR
jgi:hypothetical protein